MAVESFRPKANACNLMTYGEHIIEGRIAPVNAASAKRGELMTPWVWLGIGWVLSWATMQTVDQPATGEYKKDRGPQVVGQVLYDWRDDTRSRDVPVKIYYPKGEGKALPVILFSHGLGGSREGYAYLGRHWASYGYVCVHIQHMGSDESVWKGQAQPMESMKKAVADPQNALNRPLDVHFVLDRLEKLQGEEGPLKGRMDLTRVGMAGHSFGAYTTMAVAGQTFITPAGRSGRLAAQGEGGHCHEPDAADAAGCAGRGVCGHPDSDLDDDGHAR
jgi:predicted dienelactone hydrolase